MACHARRVSHLCSRWGGGINSPGISINFVPRRRWSIDESENGIFGGYTRYRRRKNHTLEKNSLLFLLLFYPFANKSKTVDSRHDLSSACFSIPLAHILSLSLSIIITGGVRSDDSAGSRAVRFTTVREFRQFTTNDSLEKREEERERGNGTNSPVAERRAIKRSD